jgi:hypothetical protein
VVSGHEGCAEHEFALVAFAAICSNSHHDGVAMLLGKQSRLSPVCVDGLAVDIRCRSLSPDLVASVQRRHVQAANRNERENDAPKYRDGAGLPFRAWIDASTLS